MTIRNLDHLFRPASVAIVGASPRPRSLGNLVLRNIRNDGFAGDIYAINPRHTTIDGLPSYRSVADLPKSPDLAVICTPAATVPGLIAEFGSRGTRAAIVLTAGLSTQSDSSGTSLQIRMLEAARPNLFRILGPNCLGLLVPGIRLNASFAHLPARPGSLAFVSQSGALCTAMLDWAQSRNIGFSHLISLGNSADVDLGDAVDYLARDGSTNAIVLYIEAISHARKFISAVRAAARIKPVIVIKGGRASVGAQAAHSHTGAMAGADNVYDAALRRAGALRVQSIDDLFDAVETLAHVRKIKGERLAIMTNGGGPGVLAADAIALAGGQLATLTRETIDKLDRALPATWSRANPVDIIGDAPPDRFRATADILSTAPEIDAILFSYAPTAVADKIEIARATVDAFAASEQAVFANWLGGDDSAEARRLFEDAHIPTFDTPERGARAFLHLVEYQRNQEALLETPRLQRDDTVNDHATVRAVITGALTDGRTMLSEIEAKSVMAAYGIPIVATSVAANADEAVDQARAMGFPVALKLLSRDISHKSDVGGVVLDIGGETELRAAADKIQHKLTELRPDARIDGFTVQQMIRRPHALELIVGTAFDPTFGPIVMFGHGGVATEVIKDSVIGLPPLNGPLARDMIARTRVSRLMAGYRDVPATDADSVARVLIKLSELIADIPEIQEIDINPLLADAQGVIALDARVKIATGASTNPHARLAIQPYPSHLEETTSWRGAAIGLRPIRPEDEAALGALLAGSRAEDLRLRFFGYRPNFRHEDLARLTQLDYDREMALVACESRTDSQERILGVVRAVVDPDNVGAEFAILIGPDAQKSGLGRRLMDKMISYLRARGTKFVEGQILSENHLMLSLAKELGFRLAPAGTGVQHACLELN